VERNGKKGEDGGASVGNSKQGKKEMKGKIKEEK